MVEFTKSLYTRSSNCNCSKMAPDIWNQPESMYRGMLPLIWAIGKKNCLLVILKPNGGIEIDMLLYYS